MVQWKDPDTATPQPTHNVPPSRDTLPGPVAVPTDLATIGTTGKVPPMNANTMQQSPSDLKGK